MFSFFKSKKNPADSAETPVSPDVESESKPEESISFAAKLKQGLARTRQNLGKQLSGLFGGGKIDEALYEELETILLTSDIGVSATQQLLENLRKQVKRDALTDSAQLKEELKESLIAMLEPLAQ
ncbi:MAG: signal recognition particle receptor subunit alpha, partial [Nitrosomonas sp.]